MGDSSRVPETMINPYQGVRVLITGHTGFKGAWLASWLLQDGADVLGLALEPEPNKPSLYKSLHLEERMDSRIVDIRDADKVRAAIAKFRPQIVFHLAAQALVRRSYADPLGTFAVNIMGTAHVLEAARSTNSVEAFVCVTSDKCYENREWVWGYRETDHLGGKDPYSASKAAAEIVAASYRRALVTTSQLRIATARGGNVIGGGDWSEDRLIPDLVRAIDTSQPLILRNPNAVRPWQHVLELVYGYLMLGKRLLEGDNAVGSWNFGPARESEVSVERLVEKALAFWGGDQASIRIEPSAIEEAGVLKLDTAKSEALLGWRPALALADSVRLTMEWYQRFMDGSATARDLVNEQIAGYRRVSQSAKIIYS